MRRIRRIRRRRCAVPANANCEPDGIARGRRGDAEGGSGRASSSRDIGTACASRTRQVAQPRFGPPAAAWRPTAGDGDLGAGITRSRAPRSLSPAGGAASDRTKSVRANTGGSDGSISSSILGFDAARHRDQPRVHWRIGRRLRPQGDRDRRSRRDGGIRNRARSSNRTSRHGGQPDVAGQQCSLRVHGWARWRGDTRHQAGRVLPWKRSACLARHRTLDRIAR